MKINFISLILLFVVITTISCKKDDGGTTNTTDTASTITFTVPTAGNIFINGTPLRVEGEMSDLNGLVTARVEIKNKTTGAVLFQQSNPTSNVTFFRFMFSWTVSGISAPTPATIKVTAIDKFSNQVSKEVDVTLVN